MGSPNSGPSLSHSELPKSLTVLFEIRGRVVEDFVRSLRKASTCIRVSKARSRRSCAAVRACDRYYSSARLSSAARGRSFHFDPSLTARSSGSSIVICMVSRPSCQLSQEQLSTATRIGASSTGSCAKARYAQVRGFSAPAATVPSARACDRPPFRREPVSRAADFRGAGAAFPTDGIVTRSNSS